MTKIIDKPPLPIITQDQLGAPWAHFAESVFLQEEDGGQGCHGPYALVATLNVRAYNAKETFEVVIGRTDAIDRLIAALQVSKARIKVQEAQNALNKHQYHLSNLEKELL